MTYPGIENDQQMLALNPDLAAVEERRRLREEEYDVWVATGPIPWGTALAAVKGDRIPKSTVERLKWDELGLVVKRTSKEGRRVLEETGAATTEERDRWVEADKAAARAERDARAAEKADAAGDATPDPDQEAVKAEPEKPKTARRGGSTDKAGQS